MLQRLRCMRRWPRNPFTRSPSEKPTDLGGMMNGGLLLIMFIESKFRDRGKEWLKQREAVMRRS